MKPKIEVNKLGRLVINGVGYDIPCSYQSAYLLSSKYMIIIYLFKVIIVEIDTCKMIHIDPISPCDDFTCCWVSSEFSRVIIRNAGNFYICSVINRSVQSQIGINMSYTHAWPTENNHLVFLDRHDCVTACVPGLDWRHSNDLGSVKYENFMIVRFASGSVICDKENNRRVAMIKNLPEIGFIQSIKFELCQVTIRAENKDYTCRLSGIEYQVLQ